MEQASLPGVLKLTVASAKPNCTTSGTAFFISSNGLALTARHLVEETCNDGDIRGVLEGSVNRISFDVVKRSGLDVALLKPKSPIQSDFFEIDDTHDPPASYRDRRVSIVSFYADYENIILSTAKIDSVQLVGDPFKWGLCAVGSNPSRSGSPVLLDDAKAVAVFVARPGTYDESGQRVDQDRGLVIPIMLIPDLPLPDQHQSAVALRVAPPGAGVSLQPISYVYPIDLTADPTVLPTDLDRAYLIKDGTITKTSTDRVTAAIEIATGLAQNAVLRYSQDFVLRFEAQLGYRFDPSVLKITPDSQNPPGTPLPTNQCSPEHHESCFEMSTDFQHLTINTRLYSGSVVDQAHGWLHAGLLTRQVPR
jgi:hypothetical protein